MCLLWAEGRGRAQVQRSGRPDVVHCEGDCLLWDPPYPRWGERPGTGQPGSGVSRRTRPAGD